VTWLDRLGVEVACAIRPTGDILQVSAGKGRTFAEAARAALSEALELASCERVEPSRLHWRAADGSEAFWSSSRLTDTDVVIDRAAVVPWARAERLDRRGEVFVPAAHVWCPSETVSIGPRAVPWTANGIGAHPDRTTARWHGLLELLEREALCRVFPEGWTPTHLERRSVRGAHPVVDSLRERGLTVHVVDATPAGWPVPVAAVLLVDRDSRAPQLAAGYACRRVGVEAIEAALFEACQSRLTEIHGAREDVSQESHEVPDWLLSPRRPRRGPEAMPHWAGSMRALLTAMGLEAASVDLAPAGTGLAVERVFVPGCRISELIV
jgi:ribosomal protein S12 methylthiotransferase accessory factor